MWNKTELTTTLGIQYPIIQAGMAGGNTTPELVAAVSNAGGLGTLGAGYMQPEAIRSAIHKIKELTSNPFAVNLLVVEESEELDCEQVQRMQNQLKAFESDLDAEFSFDNVNYAPPSFKEQLAVILEEDVPVFSFAFNIPSSNQISALKQKGIKIIGTATTVKEGILLEKSQVDVIVAQGSEAGGHRGTFVGSFDAGLVGSMALIPQIVDRVNVPVVASGGIMDGRGIVAALALGASGVQMGTAFLTTDESGAHPSYIESILKSVDTDTVVTKAFSGRPARGIQNKFITQLEAENGDDIPEYPIQNALTKQIRAIAKDREKPEYMSLWAGQAGNLARELSAKALIENLTKEVEKCIQCFS